MFQHSFRIVRSRHPLVRLLVGVVGLLVAAMLVAIGFFALVVLVIGGGIFMLVRSLRSVSVPATHARASPAPPQGVIEGEFTVVPDGPSQDSAAHRSAPAPR
jgi:hypothetical protein